MRQLFRELKRRHVFRVAAVYAVVAWVVIQVANVVLPRLQLPGWTVTFVIMLVALGFPIVLVVAWAFEVTPEGVRRTADAKEEAAGGSAAYPWIGLAVVVLVAGGVWYATAGDGGEPTSETAATSDTTAARTASTARDTAGPPRIAVLPFENIARDTEDAFFAEGMHEEVLNQLSKVSGLEVISRTSVMGYADTDKRVPVISEELGGVNALLEGTVRRAGDQVRITTQLIAAPEDEHLWSNTYDRALSVEQIFDIQADIAEQIAGALETELAAGERRRIEEAPTDDLAAYDAYLQGRSERMRYWGTLNPAHADRAVDHLRDAIRRDSAFAEAHALLGQAYVARATSGPDRWLDSAMAAAERALSLDPDLTEALHTKAQVYRRSDSLEAAEELYGRILEREPNNVQALEGMNDIGQDRDEPVERVRWMDRAVRLEPRAPFYVQTMGVALSRAGLWDPAAAWFRRAIDLAPDRSFPHVGLALIQARTSPEAGLRTLRPFLDRDPAHLLALRVAGHLALRAGDAERAKAYMERVPEAQREFYPEDSPSRPDQIGLSPVDRMVLGLAERRLGHRERGRRLLEQAADSLRASADRAEPGWDRAVHLAAALVALGRRDEALQHLERTLRETTPRPSFPWDLSSAFFDDFRSDPRFQEIVREVEAEREKIREEVRQLGIDLYPPGAEPDTVTERVQADD